MLKLTTCHLFEPCSMWNLNFPWIHTLSNIISHHVKHVLIKPPDNKHGFKDWCPTLQYKYVLCIVESYSWETQVVKWSSPDQLPTLTLVFVSLQCEGYHLAVLCVTAYHENIILEFGEAKKTFEIILFFVWMDLFWQNMEPYI